MFIVFTLYLLLHLQEGSDHEEGEDADGEEEVFDVAGEETSDDSDTEELEEKGKVIIYVQKPFLDNHTTKMK